MRRPRLAPSYLCAVLVLFCTGGLCAQTSSSSSDAQANGSADAEQQRIARIIDSAIARQREKRSALEQSKPLEPIPALVSADATPPDTSSDVNPPLPTRSRSMVSRSGTLLGVPKSTKSNSHGSGSWVFSTLASLGVVIGLILLLRWGWAKLGGHVVATSSPAVEVLSRTTIAPRNHILLVRVAGRILVLSDSSHGLRSLSEIDDAQQVAELLAAVSAGQDNSISNRFHNLLSRYNGDYDRKSRIEEGADEDEHYLDRARDSVSSLLCRVRMLANRGGKV